RMLRVWKPAHIVECAGEIQGRVGTQPGQRVQESRPVIPRRDIRDLRVEPLDERLDQVELGDPIVYLLEMELPQPRPPFRAEWLLDVDASPLEEPPHGAPQLCALHTVVDPLLADG